MSHNRTSHCSKFLWCGKSVVVRRRGGGIVYSVTNISIFLHHKPQHSNNGHVSPNYRCSFTLKWRWKGEGACARVSVALGALALLAAARVAVLQGSLPAFSPQDNPPAFHPSFLVRWVRTIPNYYIQRKYCCQVVAVTKL